MSASAEEIIKKIDDENTKLGDLRTIAKEIKKDYALAEALWSSGKFQPRMLAILIMDKKQLSEDRVNQLIDDIDIHEPAQRLHLADWLMANQLMADKKTIAMLNSWQHESSALKRRLFWYYQGRLRWTGQKPPENSAELLKFIEKNMASESPEVQWAMNFTAGWIGVYDKIYREKCIAIGEKLGLYKDDMVSRNCTPNYLPKFIEIEAGKRNL